MKPFKRVPMTLWSSAWIIFGKEWREALRDKKAIFSVLVPAIILPLSLILMMTFLTKMIATNMPNISHPTPVKVANLKEALHLKEQFIEHNFDPVLYEGDWLAAQKLAQTEPVVWLPDNYLEKYQRGDSIEIILLYDSSKTSKSGEVNRLRHAINLLNTDFSQARLMSLGLSSSDINAFQLKEFNVASEKKMTSMILSGLPMIVVLITFIASIGFAVDMSSGEREKRTLESLIVVTPSNWAVIFGKYLTLLSVVLVVNALFFTLLATGFSFIDFKAVGISAHLEAAQWMQLIVLMLPLMILAPALQLFVGFGAKSFKEGQTAISMLIFLTVLPNIYYLVSHYNRPAGYEFIPILYQHISILDVLAGEPVSNAAWFIQAVLCGLLCGVFLWLTQRKLSNPKTLYAS